MLVPIRELVILIRGFGVASCRFMFAMSLQQIVCVEDWDCCILRGS